MRRLVQHCFDFTLAGNGEGDIVMTRRSDGKRVDLKLGTDNWRAIHFTAFRKNAEGCTPTSPELPWDVQVYIQNLVWEDAHDDSEALVPYISTVS